MANLLGHSGRELGVELNPITELQNESLAVSIFQQMSTARFARVDSSAQTVRGSVSSVDLIKQRNDKWIARGRTHRGSLTLFQI